MRTSHTSFATVLFALATVAVVAPGFGCASQAKYRESPLVSLEGGLRFDPLKRSEYEVLADTEGTGCAEWKVIALWPIPLAFTFSEYERTFGDGVPTSSSGLFASWGASGSVARRIARFEAIGKIEGADALLGERWDETVDAKNYFWYMRERRCATVKAKAIRIKTDR